MAKYQKKQIEKAFNCKHILTSPPKITQSFAKDAKKRLQDETNMINCLHYDIIDHSGNIHKVRSQVWGEGDSGWV